MPGDRCQSNGAGNRSQQQLQALPLRFGNEGRQNRHVPQVNAVTDLAKVAKRTGDPATGVWNHDDAGQQRCEACAGQGAPKNDSNCAVPIQLASSDGDPRRS